MPDAHLTHAPDHYDPYVRITTLQSTTCQTYGSPRFDPYPYYGTRPFRLRMLMEERMIGMNVRLEYSPERLERAGQVQSPRFL